MSCPAPDQAEAGLDGAAKAGWSRVLLLLDGIDWRIRMANGQWLLYRNFGEAPHDLRSSRQ